MNAAALTETAAGPDMAPADATPSAGPPLRDDGSQRPARSYGGLGVTPEAHVDNYRRQTGRTQLTPAQARRDRHKTNRAKRRASDTATANVQNAVDGPPHTSGNRGGSPASPAVEHSRTGGGRPSLRPGT